MFIDSVVSAVGPEMFGHEPLAGVEQFREKNPVAGFSSQLLGIAAPYGAVGAAAKLPKIAGALDKVGDTASILGNAKSNAVLLGGGVEAPRIAGSALTGGDIGDTAASAGINTALELGFGGLGGYFRAAGKVDKKLAKLGSTVDLKQSPQVISQDLLKAIDEGKIGESDLPYAKNMLSNLDEAIRTETLSGDNIEKYVKELADGDAQPLNRLFKYSATPQKNPIEVKAERGNSLAIKFIVKSARNRPGKTMISKLSSEIIDASNNIGNSVKKREEIHKMAESNKAFASLRF